MRARVSPLSIVVLLAIFVAIARADIMSAGYTRDTLLPVGRLTSSAATPVTIYAGAVGTKVYPGTVSVYNGGSGNRTIVVRTTGSGSAASRHRLEFLLGPLKGCFLDSVNTIESDFGEGLTIETDSGGGSDIVISGSVVRK